MQFLRSLIFFISFLMISSQQAYDMDGDDDQHHQQQQQQQINRETIEAILNLVSPACKSEMEAAIESQTDVSPECKGEIQQAVQIISGYNRRESQGEEDQQESAPAPPPPRDGIHPGYWIAAFVVALVGGVTAYVMHVNKLLEEAFPPKPVKKLSKKKMEKARMKGGQ